MRKIIYNLAVSLDSFIEDQNGAFDWCFTDQDYGLTEMMAGIDTIIFGRKSYDLMLNYEANPYPDKQKFVCSNSLQQAPENTTLLNGNITEQVAELKQQPGKNIWLFGGTNLASQLLKAGLIDELQLSIHPILLGQGKPLFQDLQERKYLKLLHTKTYETGLVQVHYGFTNQVAQQSITTQEEEQEQ